MSNPISELVGMMRRMTGGQASSQDEPGERISRQSSGAVAPPTSGSRVSLHMSADGLPNMDSFREGRSDPFVIVEVQDPADPKQWTKICQTETVFNNLNPRWYTTADLDYTFENKQALRFRIYDRDEKGNDLEKQDYMGLVECNLASILMAEGRRVTHNIHNENAKPGARTGKFTIRAEELKADMGDEVTLRFGCSQLRGARRPFYTLSRQTSDGSFVPVHVSEVLRSYSSASTAVNSYKELSVNLIALCNDNKDLELRVEFSNYDTRGNYKPLGSCTFTLKKLEEDLKKKRDVEDSNARQRRVVSYRLHKSRGGSNMENGYLNVLSCTITNKISFLDYIKNGQVVFNTVFAIDMSSTNGNPRDPNSLQYDNPRGPNEYEIAIGEVGAVLSLYDSTQAFRAYGLSACLPPEWRFSDCFELEPGFCSQVRGVVEAYRKRLREVAPHRPCRFNPVFERVIQQVRDEDFRSQHSVYTVMVLVTDGAFEDFPAVADSIVAAAELPLSIVIVGVGDAEMPQLETLDGDEKRLTDSKGIPASRDIVQFVPFKNHRGHPAKLSQEVLAEIPDQLCSYYRGLGIRPGEVRPSSDTFVTDALGSVHGAEDASQGTATPTEGTSIASDAPNPSMASPSPVPTPAHLSPDPSSTPGPIFPPTSPAPSTMAGPLQQSMSSTYSHVPQVAPGAHGHQSWPNYGWASPGVPLHSPPHAPLHAPSGSGTGYPVHDAPPPHGYQYPQQYAPPQHAVPMGYTPVPAPPPYQGGPPMADPQYAHPPNTQAPYTMPYNMGPTPEMPQHNPMHDSAYSLHQFASVTPHGYSQPGAPPPGAPDPRLSHMASGPPQPLPYQTQPPPPPPSAQ